MWIFTSGGFVSIVENYNQPGFFLVRARKEEHLREFLSAQGQLDTTAHEISETPGRDYRWRASVLVQKLKETSVLDLRAITYPNFKNSIHDGEYRHVASDVWTAAGSLQKGGPYGIGHSPSAYDNYSGDMVF